EGNPAGLELWRGRLGTAGIPAFILGNIQFDADRAPRMLVPEERLDAALRLLAEENNWNPLTLELYQRLFHRDPPESP
ncbi:MAG TPA: hypothetical protein VEI97_07125, partial [bacterium]|nr:hypothetical protein [bacterium]